MPFKIESPFSQARQRREKEKNWLVSSHIRAVSRGPSLASSGEQKAPPGTPSSSGERWRCIFQRPFLNTWLPEILALTFSAACLIAIIVVLKVYESRSIPQIPFGLTLNAIISILATGSKSSLLLAVAGAISQLKWSWFASKQRKLDDMQEFDDASRGPWGSVSLLFTINVRSLASVGALVTLLSLAYDPFVQQVLKYPVREIQHMSNETTTMKADIFIPDANTPAFGNALYAGIWSENAAFDRAPSCPSGNCNWPTFRSMGWCSKCENITSRIVLDDCPFEKYYDRNLSSLHCNLTFDDNPSIRYAWGHLTNGTEGPKTPANRADLNLMSQVSWPVHTSSNNTGPTILGINNPALVFAFVSLYYLTPSYTIVDQTDGRIRPSVQHAEQCVLTPCARTYDISTHSGTTTAAVLEENYGGTNFYTVPMKNNAPSPFATQQLFCWQPDPGNLTWTYILPDGPTGARSGLYNPWIPYVAERWTNVTAGGFCSLYDYQEKLTKALAGGAVVEADGRIPGEGQGDLWEWMHDNPYANSGWSPEYTAMALRKMTTTNLTTVVGGVAAALTKLGLDLSNVTVPGNVSTSEVYVAAEWKWLIFPMALEGLGVVLLVATIVGTSMQRTRLWKSSVLPLLYHGLDEGVVRGKAPARDVFGMEEEARKTSVRLQVSGQEDRVLLVA